MYVKEVLDRIELPPWDQIPDEATLASKPDRVNHWTIPETEITLVRIEEGLHEGQWVFSSETDERAAEFYRLAKHLRARAVPAKASISCSFRNRAGSFRAR